jgi:hypothetical protein
MSSFQSHRNSQFYSEWRASYHREKVRLSDLYRRGGGRQRRHQELDPALAKIRLRLRTVSIAKFISKPFRFRNAANTYLVNLAQCDASAYKDFLTFI